MYGADRVFKTVEQNTSGTYMQQLYRVSNRSKTWLEHVPRIANLCLKHILITDAYVNHVYTIARTCQLRVYHMSETHI